MTEPLVRARRDMIANPQFPEEWTALPLARRFTASEYERMSIGFISRDMDDKWDIYVDGDTFYFHRSWTGLCIFRMQLKKKDGDYEISKAAFARYPPHPSAWWKLWQRFRQPPPQEIDIRVETRFLSFLIDVALLGKPDTCYPWMAGHAASGGIGVDSARLRE